MKILHLDTDDIDNPLTGGGARKNYEIYKRLSSRHEITVLTASFPGSTPEIIRDGIRYIRLGRGNTKFGLSYHLSYLSQLPFAVGRHPHDLLVEDFMPPAGGVYSFFWTRKPVIANVQWLFACWWAKKYKLPFHYIEELSLRVYKRFIVQSELLKNKIERINSRAVTKIVPCGVDKSFLEVPFQAGEYILFVGRIDIKQKGIDILLKSYADSLKAQPYRLVIAGDGFEMDALKKMVIDLGLTSKVDIIGKITNKDKVHWFSRARIVCMPSRFETFGLVALEAQAFGKPVVCFDIPALNELVTSERGAVARPFSGEEYTSKMLELVFDDEKLKKMEQACRGFAKNFTWDNIAQMQEKFYEEAIK